MSGSKTSASTVKPVREKRFVDIMVARFVGDTFARIEAVLGSDEDRSDFVRDAVDREILRRQKQPGDGDTLCVNGQCDA